MQEKAALQHAGALSIANPGSLWRAIVNRLSSIERQRALAMRVVVGAWLITRGILFAGMLLGHSYCDPAFYKYAGLFANGHWPYSNVAVEYPPLAMILILLPALPLLPFSAIAPRPDVAFVPHPLSLPQPDPVRYGAYGVSFAVMLLLLDALTLWLVMRAARRFIPSDPVGLRSALLYLGLVFLSGALLQKFDLAAGTLCLLSVFMLLSKRYAWAGAALGSATLIKGFPALALPIFVVVVVAAADKGPTLAALRTQALPLRRLVGAFALVVGGATLAVALWAGFGAVWHTVAYHTERGTEIESLYGNVLLLLAWLPALHATTAFSGEDLSRVVISPLNGAMSIVATLALLVCIALAYLAAWRAFIRGGFGPRNSANSGQIAIVATLAVLVVFEVTFRALPAHYLLVVAPLGVLVRLTTRRWSRWWVTGLVGIAIISQVIISTWHSLVTLQLWAVALLTARNLCWALAVAALLTSLWLWPRGSEREHLVQPTD